MPPSPHRTPARRRPAEDEPHPHPKPWERGLTLDEGVSWMIADDAGLDGRALARAGRAAHGVLRLLRAAAQAPSQSRREKLAKRTATALAKLDDNTRAALSQPVRDRLVELTAGQGQHPADAAPTQTGGQPSVNPHTGVQEFAGPNVWRPRPPSQIPGSRTLELRPEDRVPGPVMQPLPAPERRPGEDPLARRVLLEAGETAQGDAETPANTPAPATPLWPPPKPGHKPDPNMPADEKARLVRDADLFRGYSKLYGDAVSFASVDAPHNPSLTEESMRHFLGSSGRDRYIDPAELRKFDTVASAENTNRHRYVTETFGDWQPDKDAAKAEKAKLDAIENGQTIQLRDRWDSTFSTSSPMYWISDPDLAASIGSSSLVTDGTFHVTRRGNELDVTGDVVHGIDDPYDFVDGTQELDKNKFQAERAQRLIDGGFAEKYRNRSRWSQPMTATVEIMPNGKRRVKRIKWGDVSPYQWKMGD